MFLVTTTFEDTASAEMTLPVILKNVDFVLFYSYVFSLVPFADIKDDCSC